MNGPFNNATVKIIKSFLSFFRSVGFRRTFTVYNSIHRTVRYASSLACSFNQIIWGIKWSSPGLLKLKPEALKSLYRSPGNKKNQLVLCKNYVLCHLGITINIKNTKFVKDLPMIDAQFRFNQCNSFREEYISVFSPYGSVLIL